MVNLGLCLHLNLSCDTSFQFLITNFLNSSCMLCSFFSIGLLLGPSIMPLNLGIMLVSILLTCSNQLVWKDLIYHIMSSFRINSSISLFLNLHAVSQFLSLLVSLLRIFLPYLLNEFISYLKRIQVCISHCQPNQCFIQFNLYVF